MVVSVKKRRPNLLVALVKEEKGKQKRSFQRSRNKK